MQRIHQDPLPELGGVLINSYDPEKLLGFETANIDMRKIKFPCRGVAVHVNSVEHTDE